MVLMDRLSGALTAGHMCMRVLIFCVNSVPVWKLEQIMADTH